MAFYNTIDDVTNGETLAPTILVVFGVSGHLARHKLLPALSEIRRASQLPRDFKILGISRRQLAATEVLGKATRNLSKHLELYKLDMESPADFTALRLKLNQLGAGFSQKPQIIFYLAVPPAAVSSVINRLGKASLNTKNIKLLLEKPFGTDLKTARQLINQTNRYFQEEQIYRIDHYLAKEVAQNIAIFLGNNALFRNVWNSHFIERIEILAIEKIGAEGRSDFYEQTGALRDLVQSHLMQLLALTLMEPGDDAFDLEQLSKQRLKALKKLKPLSRGQLKKAVVAQYKNYPEEVDKPESDTETFISLDVSSRDSRWKNVDINLATGKRLSEKITEIRIFFKKTHDSQANLLALRIQPREGIELELWVKQPGYDRKLKKLSHRFDYGYHFTRLPEAYEQVLVDAMRGSHGLFASSEEVLASWLVLQPLIDWWDKGHKNLKSYKAGAEVEEVLGKA